MCPRPSARLHRGTRARTLAAVAEEKLHLVKATAAAGAADTSLPKMPKTGREQFEMGVAGSGGIRLDEKVNCLVGLCGPWREARARLQLPLIEAASFRSILAHHRRRRLSSCTTILLLAAG